MTKAELVGEVALKTGVSRVEILNILEATMETIQEQMAEGENVYLRGFGSFVLKTRAQKVARNILKNTSLIVPEHQLPSFKPCDDFVERVNKAK